jgi:hypothetical protein
MNMRERQGTNRVKLLSFGVLGGIVITLLTGLARNTPAMLVGADWYGYPLAWLVRMIVAPQYFPWVVQPFQLIADVVFWSVIIAVALLGYAKISKK